MVSTRGVRYKFSEGERVLCYEPDPNKAKVLYDSKVLEVIDSKDKRGRRAVEYLIHFQGWNSSWDRCVSEDFVLKDTEENRRLQRDLAEKAQLQLGAYLYRRERKRGSMSTGSGAAKRSRLGFSDDGSCSMPSFNTDLGLELRPPNSGEDSSEELEVDDDGLLSPPTAPCGRATINIPPALRDRLTLDFHLVVKRGKRARLPATPSAATILESFVKWYARAGAWHPPRQRNDPPHKPNMRDVSCNLNLVREVADGLRMYFDFVLRGQLLYRQEAPQYHHHCANFHCKTSSKIKRENSTEKFTMDSLKSPTPEYSHLPPDPAIAAHTDDKTRNLAANQNNAGNHAENNNTAGGKVGPPVAASETEPVKAEPQEEAATKRPVTRPPPMARRLRSHKSALSHSENEEPAPSTSTCDPPSSSVCSSGSSPGDSVPRALPAAPASRTPLSLLLDKVSKWEIIPMEGTEHLPCRVYGAIHLARLFVRLPKYLLAANMPDYKLKVVLKYIDMFVQYLDEHAEWFGESQYESAEVTPVTVTPVAVSPVAVAPESTMSPATVTPATVTPATVTPATVTPKQPSPRL